LHRQDADRERSPPPPHAPGPGPGRRAGVLVPLFSLRSASSWGAGEIPDLARAAIFCQRAGFGVLQILPTNEVLGAETSPYSASSAFAIDPVYLGLEACEDFAAAGGRGVLDAGERTALEAAQAAPAVEWEAVRRLKRRALRVAFDHFLEHEWCSRSARANELERFVEAHAAWLPDHALFIALHDERALPFWSWPAPLAERRPAALEAARAEREDRILEVYWRQWQLDRQWRDARAEAAALGVELMGDLPFMVAADSSDVWSRPSEFRRDRRIGTPPDAFSEEGQDWGLPAYDWDAMARAGYAWMRLRAERAGALYALFRLDHVIGMYRTFWRSVDGEASGFAPAEEPEQIRLGEALLGIFEAHGRVVAEDLGLVPPFLRPSLDALGIPGYRVLRWEKEGDGRYRDPSTWPENSVATTGTHDLEPNAVWWDALPSAEREALCALPALAAVGPADAFDDRVRDALLSAVYGSDSRLVIVPLQDALGARERVNLPGTVSRDNWSYRVPQDSLALAADRDLTARLAGLAARTARARADDAGGEWTARAGHGNH
jgi:4-alpha-glucanotransferase